MKIKSNYYNTYTYANFEKPAFKSRIRPKKIKQTAKLAAKQAEELLHFKIDSFKYSADIDKQSLGFAKQNYNQIKEMIDLNKQSLQIHRHSYPRKVEFKPAQSIEEANDFLKKNYGIEENNTDDLQIANIINKAITYVNNLSNGKKPLFSSIEHKFFPASRPHHFFIDDETIAQTQASTKKLWINKWVFNFKTLTPEKMETAVYHELGHLLYKNEMMKNLHLSIIENHVKKAKQQQNYIQQMEKVVEEADKKLEKIQELLNPPKPDFKQKVMIFINKIKNKKQPDPFQDLFKLDTKAPDFEEVFKEFTLKYKEYDVHPCWGYEERQVAKKVSQYAAESYEEFLSETFARLCMGQKLDDEVIALYKKLNGPMLKKFNI